MKKNIWKRVFSLVLCMVLVASYLPTGILPAVAVGNSTALDIVKVADPNTMDDWRTYFGTDASFNTEFAGAVWTDKSVFTDATAFSNISKDSQGNDVSITMTDPNDMLIALSAMGSNMTITGQSDVPTDTMLVLDVSGSMNDGNNDVAAELAEAANATIHELLTSNANNRVGVVLYSGPQSQNGAASNSDAVLLLPLGRYTTGTDNEYVAYSYEQEYDYWDREWVITSETISLDSDVVIENTTTRPSTTSKEVVGATYIQKGVILAMNQFIDNSNQTTVDGVTRKPIMVLMSDGAPTVTDTDFTDPGAYDLGDGTNNSTDAAQGFVTQLSCAYAKARIEAKYVNDMLFYTLGLGTTGNQVATSVLDPKNSNSGITTFWTRYQNTATNGTLLVEDNRGTSNDRYVTKIDTPLEQVYVDKYFSVSEDENLAQGLINAFEQIVGDIQLQSKYYPTLVGDDADLSGYISFVDKIGTYMSVTDVKGLLLHDHLYSGLHLAQNFVAGGGILGTEANPTAAGTAMMESVRDRLGLGSDEAARSLIHNAYYYGQLSYDAGTGKHSNYIGWYANAAGQYLGFYQEGVTALPAPTGDPATDPAYTVKSYGFLGNTDPAHGVSESDMMYATVQVRHSIATDEEEMILKIPAALIPTITYEVSLEANGSLKGLAQTGATSPFRLLYEVGLDSHINSLNVTDYVSQDYLNATGKDGKKFTVNDDGSINFYTNKFDATLETGYGTSNTYSYFNPSHQNDKYYFQDHAMVYSDQNGTLYTGSTDPEAYNGTLYRQHISYKKVNGQLVTDTHYHVLAPEGRAAAVQTTGENTWYVPEGTVYTNMEGFTYYKGYTNQYDAAKNLTDTLHYAKQPFVDVYGHSVDETSHRFTIGSTLGNNGKLTVIPATGLKLTKTMAEGAAATDTSFTFTVEDLNSSDSSTYDAVLENADGTQTETSVTFSGGKATVQLKAGQSLYITGLTAGTQYKITETETTDHVAVTANGSAGNSTTVTVTANQVVSADFVNRDRGTGNLMITKEVAHAQAGHTVPASVLQSQTFPITVTVPATLAGEDVVINTGTGDVDSKVPAGGVFTFDIKHGQTIAIKGLPEGTVATASEGTVSAPFAFERINSRDHSGAELDNDGKVTIAENGNATAIIHNKYQPASTTADLDVKVTKNFISESALTQNATFTFQVQAWNDEVDSWMELEDGHVYYYAELANDKYGGTRELTFTDVLKNITYTEAGDYAYRVIEKIPDNKLPGVTYDRTVWAFTVHVTDNNGQLAVTIKDNSKPEPNNTITGTFEVSFKNTAHRAPVSIDVVKEVSNTAGNAETPVAGFVFEAYEANADWSLLDNDADFTVLSDAVGKARFAATYEQVGSHYFVVKEVNEGKPGWVYDNTEYYVKVDVMDPMNDGNLRAGTMIQKVTYDEAGTPTVHAPVPGAAPVITFQNTYDPTDAAVDLDAAVRKNLEGRTLNAGEFTFAVFPDGQASHTNTANALLTGINAADGSVNFSGTTAAVNAGKATSDGSLLFSQIGTYKFDVVEITGAEDKGITYSTRIYDLVVEITDDGSGQLAYTYYYEDVTGQTATFTNRYTAAQTTYTVSGTKVLTGKALINDEFAFTMTEVANANGSPLAGAQSWTTTNAIDGSFSFPAIPYTAAGTHYYLVSEKQEATTGGITFDQTSYIVTVTVTDNGEGQLVAAGQVNSPDGKITFTNHYVPAKTSSDIPGTKTLEGKVLGAGAYSFQLYTSNDLWQNLGALGQPVPNDADGNFRFPAIEYNTAGTYYYLVEEVDGGKTINGVTYDDSVFRVQVTVTDDLKGQLHAETVVFDENYIPQIGVQFVNVYQVTGDAALVLEGTKFMLDSDGQDSARKVKDGEFTFELYAADENYTISGNPIKTTTNAANGQFSIRLDYTADKDLGKTYYYVLKEKNAGQKIEGVTYSQQSYQFRIRLLDNNDGTMQVSVLCNNAGLLYRMENGARIAYGITFVNTYSAEPTHVVLEGSKKLEGPNGTASIRDLKANDFTFELYKASDSTFTVSGNPLLSVSNNANGAFTFGSVKLDKAQDYFFVIKEKYDANDSIGGVAYDPAKYHITVKVADDGQGKLYVDSIIYQKISVTGAPTTENSILFTNTYDPADATVAISGKKTLEGRNWKTGDSFTFALQETDDQFNALAGTTPAEKVNSADGSFAFDPLTFDAPGTYYYTVTEKAGDPNVGITYDDAIYKIKIVVTDDKNGKLIPTVTVDNSQAKVNVADTDATVTDVNFLNRYAAKATLPVRLTGGKTLFGDRELKKDDFTFQMFKADAQFNIQGAAYKTVKNDENGSFIFQDIIFDTAGIHRFVIKESSENPIKGITYDSTVYHLTYVVEDDLLGKLQVTDRKLQKVTAEGTSDVTAVNFTNSYDAEDATLSLSGKKVLKGKALTDGEFTFQLVQADDKFVPMTGHGVIPSQTVNKGESFTFDALTYDTVGTYYYVVTEVNTGNERTTFDESVYHVTVTVTDEGGVLKAVATYEKGGKAASEMVFTNVYTPKPADLPLTVQVQKNVKNVGKETIGPEGFTFVLEESADSKIEATTDKDGKATFQLTATEDMIGEVFKLKLYEKNDGKAHVTYSTAVHEITVTIRLGSDNKLVADLTVDGKATEQVNVAFENVYDYTIPATPHTGDSTPVVLLFSLLAVSGMALAAAVVFRKKIFG